MPRLDRGPALRPAPRPTRGCERRDGGVGAPRRRAVRPERRTERAVPRSCRPPRQRHIGLAVARRRWRGSRALDGLTRRRSGPRQGAPCCGQAAGRSARRRPSNWPTSGWASSARRPVPGRRAEAASSASSSYAVTCEISPAYSGSRTGTGRARRPGAVDRARHLDHRVFGQEGQRSVVEGVHHVDVLSGRGHPAAPPPAPPRPRSRTLRPASPAAPASRRAPGLRTGRGARVRSRRPRRRARAFRRRARAPPRRGRRSSAGSRTARRPAGPARPAEGAGPRRSRRRARRAGAAAGPHRPGRPAHPRLPGEVVETHVVEMDVGRRQVEQRREFALEADGHVAQPDRLCPARSRARVTIPTGLVKSMIQASGLARRTRSAMSGRPGPCAGPWPVRRRRWFPVRHSRTPAARSRRGDARPARRRGAGEHRIGAFDPGIEIGGGGEPSRMPLPVEDPTGQCADQLQALGGGVDQDQFTDRQRVTQPGEAVDRAPGCRWSRRRTTASFMVISLSLPSG